MERPTVDLANDRSRTVRLSKPGVVDKPRNNGGAYSVVSSKKPAGAATPGTVARVGVGAPSGCDLLDVSDGHVMLRIHGAVVKLSEADARGLVELLAKALP